MTNAVAPNAAGHDRPDPTASAQPQLTDIPMVAVAPAKQESTPPHAPATMHHADSYTTLTSAGDDDASDATSSATTTLTAKTPLAHHGSSSPAHANTLVPFELSAAAPLPPSHRPRHRCRRLSVPSRHLPLGPSVATQLPVADAATQPYQAQAASVSAALPHPSSAGNLTALSAPDFLQPASTPAYALPAPAYVLLGRARVAAGRGSTGAGDADAGVLHGILEDEPMHPPSTFAAAASAILATGTSHNEGASPGSRTASPMGTVQVEARLNELLRMTKVTVASVVGGKQASTCGMESYGSSVFSPSR